ACNLRHRTGQHRNAAERERTGRQVRNHRCPGLQLHRAGRRRAAACLWRARPALLDFMWPMVSEGALGVIVLVSAGSQYPLETTIELLQEFSRIAPQASLAVGITRTDQHGDVLVPQFRQALYA